MIVDAMTYRAAGAAEDGQSEEVDNRMVRSDLRMLSLHNLTVSGAFSGSDRHLARLLSTGQQLLLTLS